jgi:hypothetical protein
MANTTKIIYSILALGVGVGGYFIYKKWKDRQDCINFLSSGELSKDYAKKQCKKSGSDWKKEQIVVPSSKY